MFCCYCSCVLDSNGDYSLPKMIPRPASAGLFSCPHFVDITKMVAPTILRTSARCYHVRETTKMMPAISATSRTWSARHALPPSCSSARYPLPCPHKCRTAHRGVSVRKRVYKNGHPPSVGEMTAITKHNLTRTYQYDIISAELCVPGRKE